MFKERGFWEENVIKFPIFSPQRTLGGGNEFSFKIRPNRAEIQATFSFYNKIPGKKALIYNIYICGSDEAEENTHTPTYTTGSYSSITNRHNI